MATEEILDASLDCSRSGKVEVVEKALHVPLYLSIGEIPRPHVTRFEADHDVVRGGLGVPATPCLPQVPDGNTLDGSPDVVAHQEGIGRHLYACLLYTSRCV